MDAKAHRWLVNELDKWRVPIDLEALRERGPEVFDGVRPANDVPDPLSSDVDRARREPRRLSGDERGDARLQEESAA